MTAEASDAVWLRRPGEPARTFAAFGTYRDLGPFRTLVQAARECAVSKHVLGRMSVRWGFVARAEAWDEHVVNAAGPAIADEIAARRLRRVLDADAAEEQAISDVVELLAETRRLAPSSNKVFATIALLRALGEVRDGSLAAADRLQRARAAPESPVSVWLADMHADLVAAGRLDDCLCDECISEAQDGDDGDDGDDGEVT